MRQLRVAEVSLVGVAVTGTTGLRGSASRGFHVTYTGDEPITTGDAELVTGGMEQSRTIPRTRAGGVGGGVVSSG